MGFKYPFLAKKKSQISGNFPVVTEITVENLITGYFTMGHKEYICWTTLKTELTGGA